jgi:hypothetical protein
MSTTEATTSQRSVRANRGNRMKALIEGAKIEAEADADKVELCSDSSVFCCLFFFINALVHRNFGHRVFLRRKIRTSITLPNPVRVQIFGLLSTFSNDTLSQCGRQNRRTLSMKIFSIPRRRRTTTRTRRTKLAKRRANRIDKTKNAQVSNISMMHNYC